jgi:Rrf2 family iron-sulfur cluster assembly transcriptional regulator
VFKSKGKYALQIMLCISRSEGESPVSKKMIAGEVGISTGYIEKILMLLKRSGFVEGVLGLHGGFYLAVEESEITAYDILEAVDEDLAQVASLKEGRSRSDEFTMQGVWQGASDLLQEYFSSISLEDLRDG